MRWMFGKGSFACLMAALLAAAPLMAADDAAKDAAKDEKPAAEAAAKDDGGADKAAETASKAGNPEAGHRSPGVAGGLAFFPGVAVHGAGHLYAGSWMKGLGLMAIEGVALGVGINTAYSGIDNMQKVADGINNGGSLTGAGDAFRDVGVVLVCGMAFLWTWFDDMAGAPIAAGEYNKLVDERAAQARLQVSPQGGVNVALVRHF